MRGERHEMNPYKIKRAAYSAGIFYTADVSDVALPSHDFLVGQFGAGILVELGIVSILVKLFSLPLLAIVVSTHTRNTWSP